MGNDRGGGQDVVMVEMKMGGMKTGYVDCSELMEVEVLEVMEVEVMEMALMSVMEMVVVVVVNVKDEMNG